MTRLAVGAVALLLALAGCGGDPKADPSPTPSTPATSPVSTTPTPPALPEAAKANTKAGAIAFVRHYIEVFNYAQRTGSVADLRSLESPQCKPCSRVRAELRRIYGRDGHIEGGRWVSKGVIADPTDNEEWLVAVNGKFEPSDVYDGPNAKPKHANGGRVLTNFRVRYAGDTWRVDRWWGEG